MAATMISFGQSPGLPQTQSGLSALFSLSDAAASVRPIATATSPSATPVSSRAPLPAEAGVEETSVKTRSSSRAKETGHKDLASGKNGSHSHPLKHRRLSSTSQARRRISDAREAVTVAAARPSPASYSSSSALEALSSLSLSQSHGHQVSTPISGSHNLHSHISPILQRGRSHTASTNTEGGQLAGSQPINIAFSSSQNKGHSPSASRSLGVGSTLVGSIASSVGEDVEEEELDDFEEDRASSVVPDGAAGKKGRALKVRKRGTIFQCESCSKVYRHPSCLVKHRWEHSPHWREASKFMYSKHQQVQLLEAATILSHLDPVSSLPEDRSHWPSFVSNGLLPPPSEANLAGMNPSLTTISPSNRVPSSSSGHRQSTPVSSSVPNGTLYSRSGVGGMAHPPSSSKLPSVSASIGLSNSGPRMSQFSVPNAQAGGITLTQVRPGLIAHRIGSATPPPPVLLPIPPALPQVVTSSSIPAPTQVQTKQVFAGAGMTVSPYADEELADEPGSDESHSEDGERIKVEPEDAENSKDRFGVSKSQTQSVSMTGVAFGGYRSQNGDGGFNALSSLGYSADSSALGANGLSATSASVSASAGGWSSSLPRSEAREDSVSISGSGSPRTRSRSRSMTRSRSNSAEFEHYSAGSGRSHGDIEPRNGFGKYAEDGMEMDYEDGVGGEESLRMGADKRVRKESERVREEEESWVDMDMDM